MSDKKQTIEITVDWLKGILEASEKLRKIFDDWDELKTEENEFKIGEIYHSAGYLSSAKNLLELVSELEPKNEYCKLKNPCRQCYKNNIMNEGLCGFCLGRKYL